MNKLIRIFKIAYLPLAVVFLSVAFTGAYFSSDVQISGMNLEMGTWASSGRAVISEVFYNPSGADTGKEWIEVSNLGGSTLNLKNYVLHIHSGGTNDYIFPDFNLAPAGHVLVHVNSSGNDTGSDLYWNNGLNMGNASGSVVLFKSLPKDSTTIVDYVEYGAFNLDGEAKAVAAVPPIWVNNTFVPTVAEGQSMALINKTSDNNQISDWQAQAPSY